MPDRDISTTLLHVPAVPPIQPPTLPPIYQTVGFRFRDHAHAKAVLRGEAMRGGGGILLFELADESAVGRFVNSLQLCALSVGIGGPLTTVFCPARSYLRASPEELAIRGVSERLVRFSSGFEEPGDLLEDLTPALRQARTGS
jgi:cystathionine beta-lyase/cystathionine gamma-synthase